MTPAETHPPPLLRVRDLAVAFQTELGTVRAADGVSFDVERGETVAIVGESGCGKSVTALAIMRLLPSPGGKVAAGKVELLGRDVLTLSEREMQKVRGDAIAMVFQEPMTSLNPVYTVGWQIAEAVRLHRDASRRQARERAIEMLRLVGIAAPETTVDAYPHQLSGGMRQRVMIAMALACEPDVLIADEPTTALDVTIQAQILELLDELKRKSSMGVVLITHDLGVVATVASRIVVMYAGEVVESGPTREVLDHPRHPYTAALMRSLPKPERAVHRARLPTIEGMVPDLRHLPHGCRFADRCTMVMADCRATHPPLDSFGEHGHLSRCLRAEEVTP